MSKTWLLVTMLLAVIVGTLVSRSPGYVLIAYQDMTLQTSLWVAASGLALLVMLLMVMNRLAAGIKRRAEQLSRWQQAREAAKGQKFFNKALVLWSLGEESRALRYLERAVEVPSTREGALVLIAQAEAGSEGRDQARKALTQGDARQQELAALIQGRHALASGRVEEAAGAVRQLTDNLLTRLLKKRVAVATKDWSYLAKDVAQSSKYEEDLTLAEHQALLQARYDLADDLEREQWLGALPKVSFEDLQLLQETFANFDSATRAESTCRKLIEAHPLLSLFLAYGELHRETADRRRKQLMRWRDDHPSANVLAGLGALMAEIGAYDEARDFFEQSLAGRTSPLVQHRLAVVLLAQGDADGAQTLLRGSQADPVNR